MCLLASDQEVVPGPQTRRSVSTPRDDSGGRSWWQTRRSATCLATVLLLMTRRSTRQAHNQEVARLPRLLRKRRDQYPRASNAAGYTIRPARSGLYPRSRLTMKASSGIFGCGEMKPSALARSKPNRG